MGNGNAAVQAGYEIAVNKGLLSTFSILAQIMIEIESF
jgi:hypothetical protein